MDGSVIISYLPLFRDAFLLTLKIGWMGIVIAGVIGVVGAFVVYFKVPILKNIIKAYVELFRNTPLLVQLFFLYFALPKLGVPIPAETAGVLGIGLLGGSYMIESFRSGLEAVAISQTENAKALGMSKAQIYRHVILPQAFSISVPSIVANTIFLLKETSVFSAISLMDLMFTAKDLIGMYYSTTESLLLLVIFYVIMLLPVSIIGNILEKKVRFAMYGD